MTPSRPTRLRLPLSRILVGVASVGVLVAAPSALSSAATVPAAITAVSIRQASTTAGAAMTLDLTWQVPDGTQAGDTFTLTLPAELSVLGGTDFALKDTDGAVVATASVQGRVVTFTTTAYAQSHIGVHGSAYFSVELSRSVQPGPHDLVFTADGVVFRDTVDVGVLPQNDFSTTATKWAKWLAPGAPGVPPENKMLWAITGPRVTGPAPVTFTDSPGPGQAIDCASFTLWSGTANVSGALVGQTFVPKHRFQVLECTDAKAVVQFMPNSGDVGKVFMLLGMSRLTDSGLTSYRNSGSVAVGGGTIPVTTVVAGAGGQGTGTTAPIGTGTGTTTATSGTGTTTGTATTTSPGTSTSTATPTCSCETATATVTQTVTHTVTQTVTATVTAGQPGATSTVYLPYPVPAGTVTVTVTAPVSPGGQVTDSATGPTSSTVSGGTSTTPSTSGSSSSVASGSSSSVASGSSTSVSGGSGTSGSASGPASSSSSSAIAGGSSTSSSVAPANTPSTPNPAVGGTPAAGGSRVNTVNTGIAPADGPEALLVGGGIVLLAGSGAGLLALSRRRSD